MTLLKALSLSEELNCFIIHKEAGLKLKHNSDTLTSLGTVCMPNEGWELDDSPVPITFQCRFLGCDPIVNQQPGGKRGAIYSFEGVNIFTLMPTGTLVKVSIEPV